jgi:DEAD/DEAH box helicase domain-containing protein
VNLSQVLDSIEESPRYKKCITAWHVLPKKDGQYREFPDWLDPRMIDAFGKRGIDKLYTHQADALQYVSQGKSIVVVTPTASGKTLCYNLPVLNSILKASSSRALYLFPTKALSQDQVSELLEIITILDVDIKTYTYDGDTPQTARKAIRSAGHIVVTNPDMLHTGVLPHHTKWIKLFENLKYVIIDEIHQYTGVFGSHVANVIRRLRRICEFYGSSPQFICCSATIANPKELAERLTGLRVELVDNNGAPQGEKHLILYNPPVVNKQLGIRSSSLLEAQRLAGTFIANGIQTIVFARTRLATELLVTYLKKSARRYRKPVNSIRGYRGGYLPGERREIETDLRSGQVLGVVSTTALELGIDIGRLDACIIAGYPGSISSTWQQLGRAGRRLGPSVGIMVASSSPLDQFMVLHPEYFLEKLPEHGLINPDNLFILISHLKCAAFELPFETGESFGPSTTVEILNFLVEERILRYVNDRYFWMSEAFPAEEVSLRSASTENVVIIDVTKQYEPRVIGEIDRFSAVTTVHQDAIYLHESVQYHVDRFDYDEKKAYVKEVDVDYYTDAEMAVEIKVLDEFRKAETTKSQKSYGEVMVTAIPTIFKKVKLHTHENLGWGHIHLPESEMHTTAFWLSLDSEMDKTFTVQELQDGLVGITNLFASVAPIYLMCNPTDIGVVSQVRSPFTGLPTIFCYDRYPGGIGLSEKLYGVYDELILNSHEVVQRCECESGCPSCVGPTNEIGESGKAVALHILHLLTADADK